MNKKDLEFTQPNALIFCQQDEYQPLKILDKFDQEHYEENKISGGWYEENYVSAQTLVQWAKLPSKMELLQNLCYYLTYHLRRLVNLAEQIKNQVKPVEKIS
jgi:ribosomal protein L10